MWFADVGEWVAWGLLACWLVAAVVRSAAGRTTRRHRTSLLLVGGGAAAVLWAAQASVVDSVADVTGHGLPGAGAVDVSVLGWFVEHRTPAATAALTAVSVVGGTVGMAVLALLAAITLALRRRGGEAVVVLGAAVGAGLLVVGFKNLYARQRPPVGDRLTMVSNAALPSGHALGSMVVLGVLAAVVVLGARRRAVRVAAGSAAALGIAVIGVSRLYLGVHWTTDVVTGWLLGGAWLAVCVVALLLVRAGTRADGSRDLVPLTGR